MDADPGHTDAWIDTDTQRHTQILTHNASSTTRAHRHTDAQRYPSVYRPLPISPVPLSVKLRVSGCLVGMPMRPLCEHTLKTEKDRGTCREAGGFQAGDAADVGRGGRGSEEELACRSNGW